MSKEKFVLSGIVVTGLVVSMGVSLYVFNNPKDITKSAASETSPVVTTSNTIEVKGDLVFDDPAGFEFRHPSAIIVTDVTPDDTEFYTILTLSKGNESMSIEIKDSGFDSVESWKGQNAANATLVGAISIDGVSAKQYESGSLLMTVAVDQGVLYVFESPVTDYWRKVHDLVLTSFNFSNTPVPSTNSNTTGDSTVGGGVIYEEEEIIQ